MKKISQPTVERLPLYYRTLQELQAQGIELVSSQELGEILNLKPVQIRRDLSDFGNFGVKGFGYIVEDLKKNIGKVLGYQYHRKIGIAGAGYLGAALANYKNFSELGFQVAALFDSDEKIIGSEIGGVKVYDFAKINSVVQRKRIDIGIIAVEKNSAQEVADILISAGVLGIWNFAPIKIEVPENISLINEDLNFGLSVLNYQITQIEKLTY